VGAANITRYRSGSSRYSQIQEWQQQIEPVTGIAAADIASYKSGSSRYSQIDE
jgi:hypothetical protein